MPKQPFFKIKIWFIIQLKQTLKKWIALGYQVVIRVRFVTMVYNDDVSTRPPFRPQNP